MWSSVPLKIAFVGIPSSGKSFLINSLLDASTVSEAEYATSSTNSTQESKIKDVYQKKTSYSFEEHSYEVNAKSSSSYVPQRERSYESHTNYEFESSENMQNIFGTKSSDSNLDALMQPEDDYGETRQWEDEQHFHSVFRDVADSRSFLIPQTSHNRHNYLIEISFGAPCEMMIETKQSSNLEEASDMDTDIWGKKFRFKGTGKNLLQDRVFLREKLIEFSEHLDHAIEKVSFKFPSHLLENSSWSEVVATQEMAKSLVENDVLVVLGKQNGVDDVLRQLLFNLTTFKGQLVFVDMHEREDFELPSQVLQQDNSAREATYRKLVTQQLEIPSSAQITAVVARPSLSGLIKQKSIPILPQHVDSVQQKTGMATLLNLLSPKKDFLSTDSSESQPTTSMTPVIEVRNTTPTTGFVASTSNSRLFPTKNVSSFNNVNDKVTLLSGKESKPISSEGNKVLALVEKFSAQLAKWKTILQTQVTLLDQLLIKKILAKQKALEPQVLLDLAQIHWEKSVGETVAKDSAALLSFSEKILEECVASLTAPELQATQEKAQSLTKFCQQTQLKVQEKLKLFDQQIKLGVKEQKMPPPKNKLQQEILVEVATFIQLHLSEKLLKDLEAVDWIEKDIKRAISSMLLLGNKSAPREIPQSEPLKLKLERLPVPIKDSDMPNLSQLSLGKRKFGNNEGEEFHIIGMEVTAMKSEDGVFRALAHQVYGDDDFHSAVKLMLSFEHPNGLKLKDAHHILKLFANVYQSTLMVFSRNTSKPLILHPSGDSLATYRIGLDLSKANFWSVAEKIHKRKTLVRRHTISKVLPSMKAKGHSVRKDSLLGICLSKVEQLAEDLPALGGAIPEHLVQQLIWRLIKSKSLTDSVLMKLLDEDMKTLSLKKHILTLSTLQITCASVPNLESLSLAHCLNLRNQEVLFVAEKLRHLHTVDLSGCIGLRDSGLQALCRSNSSLWCLNLENCINLTDIAVREVLLVSKMLIKLVLKGCRQLSDKAFVFLGPSALQWLDLTEVDQLTNQGLSQIATYCKSLTVLKLTATQLTDASVNLLSQNCLQLATLELHNAVQLSETTLATLPQQMMKELTLTNNQHVTGSFLNSFKNSLTLNHLDLCRCFNISELNLLQNAQGWKSLNLLNISYLEGMSPLGLATLTKYCPQLTHLNFAKTNVSDEVIFQVAQHLNQRLKTLSLYACQQLTDDALLALAQWCPNLIDLDISNTKNFTAKSLLELFLRCKLKSFNATETDLAQPALESICKIGKSLKRLKLGYSSKLTDSILIMIMQNCPNVKLLDVSYCVNMNPEVLKFCGKYWPRLEELVLKGIALKNTGFSHRNVKTLHLSWCKQLLDAAVEEIAAGCTELVSVDLSWSSNLTCISLQKLFLLQSLKMINIRGCSQISLSNLKINRTDVVVYR